MTADRLPTLSRIRDRLAAREPVTEAETPPQPEPTPPRREHVFGSQYRVRVGLAEVLTARGLGAGVDGYRRRIVPSADVDPRRVIAAAVTRRGPDIMWLE